MMKQSEHMCDYRFAAEVFMDIDESLRCLPSCRWSKSIRAHHCHRNEKSFNEQVGNRAARPKGRSRNIENTVDENSVKHI